MSDTDNYREDSPSIDKCEDGQEEEGGPVVSPSTDDREEDDRTTTVDERANESLEIDLLADYPNIVGRYEWTDDLVLKFIKLFEEHRCLWDTKHSSYKSSGKKTLAWLNMEKAMGVEKCELKRKMNSLRASFRRERTRVERENFGREEGQPMYVPTWFAYAPLEFLQHHYSGQNANCKRYKHQNYNAVLGLSQQWTFGESGELEIKLEEDKASSPSIYVECDLDDEQADEENDSDANSKSWTEAAAVEELLGKRKYRQSSSTEDVSSTKYCCAGSNTDPFDAYGRYVAAQLRRLDCKSQAYVQKAIGDALFQAQMGNFRAITYDGNTNNTSNGNA